MERFHFAELTDLEKAETKEALQVLIGRMLDHSATVKARIDELTFETGEYAIVLRGVLRRPEGGTATG